MEKINSNKIKPKSIIVDGDLHNRFKVMCKGKSIKIGGIIEDLMKLYLDNPRITQKMIDEIKDKQINHV
ncbi:MAG: hypothetical protein ACOC22_00225 [bacterium]